MYKILKNNKHQTLRMKRISLALLGGFFHTLACILLWHAGYFRMSEEHLILMFSIIWIGNLIFPFMVLTRMNRYFKDPSLTLIMVLWSQVVVMFTLYFIEDYRSFMLMFGILGIAFSSFRLENRQAIFAAFFSVSLYLIVLLVLQKNHPGLLKPIPEWMVGFSYSFIALCTAIVASEVSAMRRHLVSKTLELESSLHFMETNLDQDALTGLKQTRYILDILQQQKSMTERESSYHFSVIIFEIDSFDKINAEQGRLVAETILKYFSTQLELQQRRIDYLARLQDGQFILVCAFTELEKATGIAERMRSLMVDSELKTMFPNLTLSVSAGVTTYQIPESVENILNRASLALTQAKEQGSNQIVGL